MGLRHEGIPVQGLATLARATKGTFMRDSEGFLRMIRGGLGILGDL